MLSSVAKVRLQGTAVLLAKQMTSSTTAASSSMLANVRIGNNRYSSSLFSTLARRTQVSLFDHVSSHRLVGAASLIPTGSPYFNNGQYAKNRPSLITAHASLGQIAGLKYTNNRDLSNPRKDGGWRIGGKKRSREEEDDYQRLDENQRNGYYSSSNSNYYYGNQNDPESNPNEKKSNVSGALSKLGALGTGLVLLGGKTKSLLVALKMTKMTSLLSMFASTAAYSFLYGPKFGIGMVGLLLAHESGHALMMRSLGYEFTPMVFVPFMGAVVGMKGPAHTAYDDARISIAGPVLGSIAAWGVAGAGIAMDSQFLMALGDFGMMINLFNLLPVGSLDGAHILGAVNKWFLVSGLVGGGFLIYTGAITNPLFYLLMFASAFTTYERFTSSDMNAHFNRPGYEMPRNKKLLIGTSYLGLIFALLATMSLNNRFRKSPAQIKEEQRREALARGEVLVTDGMGETMLGWAKELEDPDYFGSHSGVGSPEQQRQLEEADPFFQKHQQQRRGGGGGDNRWI